ncbi:hypothetical protein M1D34_31870 (plasmid) [Ensifer sp. D2-11]
MIKEAVWRGVETLIDHYVRPRPSDAIIVVFTSETVECASWIKVALQLRGLTCSQVWMVPLEDQMFSERFASVLPKEAELIGDLIVITLELNTLSHDQVLRTQLSRFDPNRTKAFRIISACEELFSEALQILPSDLSARNATVLSRLMEASELRLTTRSGSDLRVRLDSAKYRWVSNRGIWKPGKFTILPPGEVATFPANIEGVFVADFAFNVNMIAERDARLTDHPITIQIENNRAVSSECADPATKRFLDECFCTYCSHIVGELGFGTNIGVRQPISLNSHINERAPGIHLGFGSSNQAPSTVGYSCDIHLDLIAWGGVVEIDGEAEPLDLETFTPGDAPHPESTYDEDARSGGPIDDIEVDDCCGILTRDGIRLFSANAPS